MAITVDIQGAEALRKELARLGMLFTAEAKRHIQEAGVNTQNEAKRKAPVDMGRLRASIQLYTSPDRLSAAVQPEVNYSPFVEWGTGNLVDVPDEVSEYALTFKGKTGVVINRQPTPYLYPAFFKNREELIDKLKELTK